MTYEFIYEEYREIIPEFMCTKDPDGTARNFVVSPKCANGRIVVERCRQKMIAATEDCDKMSQLLSSLSSTRTSSALRGSTCCAKNALTLTCDA